MANDLISVDLEIKGLGDLERTFLDMSAQLNKQVLRVATYAAAAKFRKEARDLAPVYTGKVGQGHPPPGSLKKSLIVKYINEESSTFQQVYKVTVRKGGKRSYVNNKQNRRERRVGKTYSVFSGNDAYYAHMVERGTSKMSAKPFMRPAWDMNQTAATETFFDRIVKFFQKQGWMNG